tara:strand:+ start:315 stop:1739 length:1425 start_codon:yes stop_codon:yes gene_type:complete
MNKTEQHREEVIGTNNTAQINLLSILDKLDATYTTDLHIKTSLHGDVDFAILSDRGFKKVNSIIFVYSGEVTSIRNIPEGIVKIVCDDQLLDNLDGLPSTLEEIDFSGNTLSKFDATNLPKLRILRISDNEITEIVNLPEGLEILDCENNQLRRLDLAGTPGLKTLKCSNNPLLMLEHVPPSLVDLEMENNPFVEIDRSKPNEKKSKSRDKKYDYLESIHEYFRLKNEYEIKLHKMKRAAYERGATKKESRMKAKSVTPPCINCKRNVGTVFGHEDQKYTAICGDKTKPCDLHIQIFSGDYFRMDDLLRMYAEDIQEDKQQIIVQKMDTLFEYVQKHTSADEFTKMLEKYNTTSGMYNSLLSKYDDIYNNEHHKEEIDRKTEEMYRIRDDIRKLLDEYKKSGNREVLIAAVEMHVKDLMPAVQNIRLSKYDTMLVETNAEEPYISTLVQRKVSAYKRDFIYGEEPKVMKFVMNK